MTLRFHAARFHGDNKRSMAVRDRQISSLYDFCDFCSSVAFTVTHLSPHSLSFCIVNLNWIRLLPILFIISPLCLWQAGELSRPWYQPGEHHGYHCPLQPANGKQQLSHGQRTRSSLQYDAFRYTGLITNGSHTAIKPLRTLAKPIHTPRPRPSDLRLTLKFMLDVNQNQLLFLAPIQRQTQRPGRGER